MRQLAEERPCIAPWVAIRFVVDREQQVAIRFVDPGSRTSQWRNSTREARRAALEEEIFRERRGDYVGGFKRFRTGVAVTLTTLTSD